MLSFNDYRKSKLQDSLDNASLREALHLQCEILRLELLEATKLPRVLSESIGDEFFNEVSSLVLELESQEDQFFCNILISEQLHIFKTDLIQFIENQVGAAAAAPKTITPDRMKTHFRNYATKLAGQLKVQIRRLLGLSRLAPPPTTAPGVAGSSSPSTTSGPATTPTPSSGHSHVAPTVGGASSPATAPASGSPTPQRRGIGGWLKDLFSPSAWGRWWKGRQRFSTFRKMLGDKDHPWAQEIDNYKTEAVALQQFVENQYAAQFPKIDASIDQFASLVANMFDKQIDVMAKSAGGVPAPTPGSPAPASPTAASQMTSSGAQVASSGAIFQKPPTDPAAAPPASGADALAHPPSATMGMDQEIADRAGQRPAAHTASADASNTLATGVPAYETMSKEQFLGKSGRMGSKRRKMIEAGISSGAIDALTHSVPGKEHLKHWATVLGMPQNKIPDPHGKGGDWYFVQTYLRKALGRLGLLTNSDPSHDAAVVHMGNQADPVSAVSDKQAAATIPMPDGEVVPGGRRAAAAAAAATDASSTDPAQEPAAQSVTSSTPEATPTGQEPSADMKHEIPGGLNDIQYATLFELLQKLAKASGANVNDDQIMAAMDAQLKSNPPGGESIQDYAKKIAQGMAPAAPTEAPAASQEDEPLPSDNADIVTHSGGRTDDEPPSTKNDDDDPYAGTPLPDNPTEEPQDALSLARDSWHDRVADVLDTRLNAKMKDAANELFDKYVKDDPNNLDILMKKADDPLWVRKLQQIFAKYEDEEEEDRPMRSGGRVVRKGLSDSVQHILSDFQPTISRENLDQILEGVDGEPEDVADYVIEHLAKDGITLKKVILG